jgi:hypothetical protein
MMFTTTIIIYNFKSLYNTAIINNDDARIQDSILLPKIHMGTRKEFSEYYRLFGHALSRMFTSPVIGGSVATTATVDVVEKENPRNINEKRIFGKEAFVILS